MGAESMVGSAGTAEAGKRRHSPRQIGAARRRGLLVAGLVVARFAIGLPVAQRAVHDPQLAIEARAHLADAQVQAHAYPFEQAEAAVLALEQQAGDFPAVGLEETHAATLG